MFSLGPVVDFGVPLWAQSLTFGCLSGPSCRFLRYLSGPSHGFLGFFSLGPVVDFWVSLSPQSWIFGVTFGPNRGLWGGSQGPVVDFVDISLTPIGDFPGFLSGPSRGFWGVLLGPVVVFWVSPRVQS